MSVNLGPQTFPGKIKNNTGSLCKEAVPEMVFKAIPSAGGFSPTVIDKSQPIESIGSRLQDHTRTFHSGVRAQSNSCRTSPAEGILCSQGGTGPVAA